MKITVVAFENCMTSAALGLLDAFAIAGRVGEAFGDTSWRKHEVRLATNSGKSVKGYGSARLDPHCSLKDAEDSDVIVIPPILNNILATIEHERATIAWLKSFRSGPALLASACTGAFLLAESGVLDGRRVTTNPNFIDLFRVRYPKVELAVTERLIEDEKIMCAGAMTSYLNLAVNIVGRLNGHELAVLTAKALNMDANPASQQPYFLFFAPKDHGDEHILKAQHWIEQRHRKEIAIDDMARAAGMSARNLNRRFMSATGMTPAQYLRRMRIESAKRLLEGKRTSIDRIAGQVGYGDTRAFMRAFNTITGLSPGEYRRKFGPR